jgi:hypothetical protein
MSLITGAGASFMLNRMRFFPICLVFLLFGLLLAAGQAMSAQSVGTTPPQPPPAQASGDASAKPDTPAGPVIRFADVARKVQEEGEGTSLSGYIAEALGLKRTSNDSVGTPVLAHALGNSTTPRKLYAIDDTGELLFIVKNGDTTAAYLANHAGVLHKAGHFYPGRFHSQEFEQVSKEKAAAGFAAEKEFWIRNISLPQEGEALKPGEPVSNTDYVKSEAGPKEKAALARKAAKESAARETTADLDKKDKQGQIQPMSGAKPKATLGSAKEKEDSSKTAEPRDTKAAGKNPPTTHENSNQQSSTDGNANRPKSFWKKIW